LTKVSGLGPPAAVLELCRWAAWRWAGPLAPLVRTASPLRAVDVLATPPPLAHSVAAARAATPGGPGAGTPVPGTVLLRRPPAEDLLSLVLAAVARAEGDGSVLVLVPSVGWAGRLADRLRHRGLAVARDWAQARAGWPVVLGSRAAAFAPCPRLAAAVVLDGHDEVFVEERAPAFDAVEVVIERAARDGVPCTVVSPCPTTVQAEVHGPVRAPDPGTERTGWAPVLVADRRRDDPRTGLLSEDLVALARRVLARPAEPGVVPLVCVLNRTGRGRLLACTACGELARCETCGSALAERDGRLVCPRCGRDRPVVCAECGATRLKVLRAGVARVGPELSTLLGVAVAEVTAESEPGAGRGAPVHLGTEAVLRRTRAARAVAFLDLDQHLLAARFAAADEALALLARAARLVGGRGPGGHVLVQTRLPGHPVVRAAAEGRPGLVVEDELPVRRELRLPPFAALALLRGPGAAAVAPALEAAPGLEVTDLGEGRISVRAPDHPTLCDALARVGRPKERLRVDVDPADV
jgi:primosomal protein N' (replication factor Y)